MVTINDRVRVGGGEEHLGADAHKTFINELTHVYFDGKRWKGPGLFIAGAFQNEIRAYARLCRKSVPTEPEVTKALRSDPGKKT